MSGLRGRLAPTPTGLLHVGHARTFALAAARAGTAGLVLRVEDLDPQRCRAEYAAAAIDDLRWLGIAWTEGPDVGGPHGPYRQSERTAWYLEVWRRLEAVGAIYPSPHSRRDVEEAATAPHEGHPPPGAEGVPVDAEPIFPPSLRPAVRHRAAAPGGVPWRFRVPDGRVIEFDDALAGRVRRTAGIDFGDFVVWRRDDLAAYELAVVADDRAMEVAEVTRGADLLTSTARQILLAEALGWRSPAWCHAPLVRDAAGNRLAKRAGGLAIRDLRAAGLSPAEVLAWQPGAAAAHHRPRAAVSGGRRTRHVLMLSEVYRRGHGVPVVIAQHAACLVAAGIRVTIGGALSDVDVECPGCARVPLADAAAAAEWALGHDVDVVVPHTPVFFGVARHLGMRPAVIAYDYGEPPPRLFPDRVRRERELADKDEHLALGRRVYAISEAVAREGRVAVHGVIPLGNAHLGRWNAEQERRRPGLRAARGWTDRFVVLDVCRFGAGERCYKGVDRFAETARLLRGAEPDPQGLVFVVAGKGGAEDVAALRADGLDVVANPSDEELHDLYVAADAYANFSQWEGYNLGIGQALALGLPTIASDIPAHRAFGIPVFAAAGPAAGWLAACRRDPPPRVARITPWDESCRRFLAAVTDPDL